MFSEPAHPFDGFVRFLAPFHVGVPKVRKGCGFLSFGEQAVSASVLRRLPETVVGTCESVRKQGIVGHLLTSPDGVAADAGVTAPRSTHPGREMPSTVCSRSSRLPTVRTPEESGM